jgi:hypothetical protein
MKPVPSSSLVVMLVAGSVLFATGASTQRSKDDHSPGRLDTIAHKKGSPIFVTKIPPGYRDWKLVSVAREEGDLDDVRAILGNDVAIKAYREGKRPFPDGAIIARLAWNHVPSEENDKAFGRRQSFVAGSPKNGVQFMVKDTRKYSSTGGWGFAHFDDGKPANETVLNTCFSCHTAVQARDLVFTQYAR